MTMTNRWRATLHLLLVIALVLPGLFWKQGQAQASELQWRDITANAGIGVTDVAKANGKLYLLYGSDKKIMARGSGDTQWTLLSNLPTAVYPIKLIVRDNGDLYVLDRGNVNAYPAIASQILKSSDNGQTWTKLDDPAGGYNTNFGYSLHTMFFDSDGNLYVADYGMLYKRDTQGAWTKIDPKPGDGTSSYRIASAAVDSNGTIYSIMIKINTFMPTVDQTTDLYRYGSGSWSQVSATLPAGNMVLTGSPGDTLYVYQGSNDFFLTNYKNIFSFDGTTLSTVQSTDSFDWAMNGMVFDGDFFYIADGTANGTIRTTDPTFGNAKLPPTLAPDTSDNDTAHAVELTYDDDADWQGAITSVDISPSVAGAAADWSADGKIAVSGLNAPGDYTIAVKATGYSDAVATQSIIVKPAPTLAPDTSDNDTAHAIELSFTDDAAWRAAITGVTLTRNGSVTDAVYSVQSGVLTLTGIGTAGEYDVAVKAAGYEDATVAQQIDLAPSTWYDITANLGLTAPSLSVDDAVYALQAFYGNLRYRYPTDTQWKSIELPQDEFSSLYTFASRDGVWYASDATISGQTATWKVHISDDRGVTWTVFELPSNDALNGAINPLTVGPTGAVYLFDSKKVLKLNENRDWSAIPVFENADGYSFAYSGIAVDGSGTLYANIRKYDAIHPLDNSAKLYKYDEDAEAWVYVADSPSAMMEMYSDTAGGMHAATMMALNGETPEALVYKVDASGFTPAATLSSLDQARYGIAYDGEYYYTVDTDFKTVRTTNPNYADGLIPPALTPDASNNDDAHTLVLTFDDDADWRSKITSVTVKKDGSIVSAAYEWAPGELRITDPLAAGTYTIEIAADGYRNATAQQTVGLTAPTLVADRTQNDTQHDIEITFADNAAWRSSVTSVAYNGTTADSSLYELTEGKLVFFAGKLPSGSLVIAVAAAGYPDATVTQTVNKPSSTSATPAPSTDGSQEIVKVDVRGGSNNGQLVSQAEIVRTTDDKGKKSDKVVFTSELAARAVEAIGASNGGQAAVIVIPDDKDEVASTEVSLPHAALQKLADAGIGLTIELRGASIAIPTASLAAAGEDVYFRVVPVKDSAAQQALADRAKANADSASQQTSVVGRPMTIDTNLQSQPVTLTLPLGSYPADRIDGLLIYIEHSEGTKEWIKGKPATDGNGGAAIAFTVTKFSTFTIVDTASPSSSAPLEPYIRGYEDGTFRPTEGVTRGQLAAMLARLYDGASADTSKVPAYADEARFPSWAADAIRQATALGLMNGYEDGTFRADRTVTRAEAASVIARAAKLGTADRSAGFTDTAGHWAAAAIDAAAQAGLVTGYGSALFAPDRTLNRAEAVTMLNRLTGREAVSDQAPQWSDVPAKHWAFGDIQAASLNGSR